MAENNTSKAIETSKTIEVSDLAMRFRKETIELKAAEDTIVLHQEVSDNKVSEEGEWDFCLIGKIITEGKMGHAAVERNIVFTWNFIPPEEIKIIDVDTNIMIFKLKNKDVVDQVIVEGPWNTDGYLCILFDYFQGLVHQNLDWTKQEYWIQLKYLQPEHMNVRSVEDMWKLLGEVLAIEPSNAIPIDGKPVKVCVNIELTTPLRRGVFVITAAGVTKWVKFYYEKQPHKLCKECFLINHCNDACKDAAEYVKVVHAKQLPFGGVGKLKTKPQVRSTASITPKPMTRRFAKDPPFVPPKDGIQIKVQEVLEAEDVHERLGKRQRFVEIEDGNIGQLTGKESTDNNEGKMVKQITTRIPHKDKQSGTTAGENEVTVMEVDAGTQKP
ncbi:uncharacterized protein LOC113290225 isoform X2 [Papaver somniferum]|uniref:uncharacterized protein LOC113290225 isoform X2 n=1 Tax=Papaver somniferum TaxID=3469 RepID=UPI000E6F6351|nr:uncharacterized protein LOC113290225 isoform X2 [Papaver somniferum]